MFLWFSTLEAVNKAFCSGGFLFNSRLFVVFSLIYFNNLSTDVF